MDLQIRRKPSQENRSQLKMPMSLNDGQTLFSLPKEGLGGVGTAFGRLRARTFIANRWLAICGQMLAVLFVQFVLGFDLPLAACLWAIAAASWLNVILMLALP